MPAIPQPFAFTGSLQLAADQSLPQDPIPFNFAAQFVALQESQYNFTGSGSKTVDFGSISAPGAKGLLIRYDAQQGAAAVLCTINSGTQPVEISPGGFFIWFNPNPSTGLTTLAIAYTAAAQLRVWLLG